MAVEHLDEDLALPYNAEAILSENKERFNDYIKQLIGELERIQLKDIRERINILIDLSGAGNIFYLGTKDSTGDYPNGTWRLNGSSATEYLIQLKETGAWNTKGNLDSAALATYVNLVLTGLTASRLTATNASKQIVSADIVNWIAGTLNQITVTDNGNGTVTLALPQSIHTGASPAFAGLTLSGLTATRLVATDGSSGLSSANLKAWIDGTVNQITVTDDGDGTVTLSLPQNIHTGADVTFATLTVTKLVSTGGRVAGTTRITATDSPYTVLATDHYLYCDTDSGPIKVILPAGIDGTVYNIKNVGSSGYDVTITPDGTEDIEDEDDAVAEDGWAYTLQFEPTENWRAA